MIGLDPPILFNSAKTKESSLVLASMVCNFSMMSSKAPITCTAFSYLWANSTLSLTLASAKATSLLSKISNWFSLLAISPFNPEIFMFNKVIYCSESSLVAVALAMSESNLATVSSHSFSYLECN